MNLQISDKKYTDDQINLIKNTVCKGATDAELELFLYTCHRTGLDPLVKQIYAIKRKSGNSYIMTIQTSIDGLRAIAERTKKYAPGQATIFQYGERDQIVSATAFVKKQTEDGTWHEVGVTAFFEEYAQRFNGELTKFWKQFPSVMISKCAEALALRKCFPFELSGIHTTEEMMNPLNKITIEEASLDEDELKKESDDLEEKKEEYVLNLPENIDPKKVEHFLNVSAAVLKVPVEYLKKRAVNNIQGFLEKFNEWLSHNSEMEAVKF